MRTRRNPFAELAGVLFLSTLVVSTSLASDHPGNIFLLGQTVRISIPAAWQTWIAVDMEQHEIARGSAAGAIADLGKPPIGFFEIRALDGSAKTTAAVIAANHPVTNTPIALDAAISWLFPEPQQIRDVCALCRLAGVNWVRDRSSWPELETARGQWAPDGKYERVMRMEHEEGLKILQVNHIAPKWASPDATRFPPDLRDVYEFYRGVAARWKGLADAIEPWNEPDLAEFGGQTGCEIASFQKAAYFGFKAGDPHLVVNQAVFAIDRAETLDEYGANEVYPYFDRYDLHHYIRLPEYPRAYARHRAVSGGRPMWTTEFNLTVWWSDEKTHEPSDEELHFQAYRVGKVFAEALHEGPEKAFYFIIGDLVERHLQYGLLHRDLTPRPAYVAFAAVGRLLNGGAPLGRLDLGDDKLKGYAFATTVDGSPRETLVLWSETRPTPFTLPAGSQAFDYLGRELPAGEKVKLTRETIFILLPPGGSKSLKLIPPPAKAPFLTGPACPIVLQIVGSDDFKQSAFVLDKSRELQIFAYNFGDRPARGTLQLEGATCGNNEITVAPGERIERTIVATNAATSAAMVTARLNLGDLGHAIVAARVIKTPTTQPVP